MPDLIPQVEPGFLEQCFALRALLMSRELGYVCPHSAWPWPLSRPLHWPGSLVQSVNEVGEWRAWSGWMRSCLHERLLRWICLIHAASGLCGGGVCGGISLTSLWCCPDCSGIVYGPPVSFRWSVKMSWRMGILEEQDGAAVGLFWFRPASGPLCTKYTLPALAATPLQQTWLNESCWVSFTSCGLQGYLCSSTHLVSLAS